MLWINLLRITVPGIVLGAWLGKLLSEKPQYLNLINPSYWLESAKRSSKDKFLRIFFLSILFGGLVFLVEWGVGNILTDLFGPLLSEENIFTGIAQFSLILFFLSITIFPIIEEWVFRGILLEEITQMSQSKWIGLFSSALLFALFHLSNPGTYPIAVIFYFVGGLVIGGSYLVGGLTVAALSHIIYNLLPFLL
ncbi:hypothetical protein AKJ37_00370 [candidate division MSBL1 archaeon SCGC-AAA259I09]|uniref:CAAX prenyl protease 2/Lysostaphin resistance protein A-like domain-containing protein n=3 Tax=candidate division MSBL1 TaxID=215777 RepID=A0A133UTL7_9EURY|nr:hypothetical protein AKJ36_01095 [candidate division MSBL1 archaeon SCGC-AAA259I07]KXA97477.1 hypothetical protein AKJ38_01050 [candidate division MSBL1 archaeon SCGC-AAA259I14]KXA98355.1 hypothetical protein AKJ37_00370 [candidate division MSBL1 archaeon SCGC-AAA259I09]